MTKHTLDARRSVISCCWTPWPSFPTRQPRHGDDRPAAHVLVIDSGWPPAYGQAAGAGGSTAVLMFRSTGQELDQLRHSGGPFFAPPWRADEMGLVLDEGIHWDESPDGAA
jgi:hypothetical protein